MGKVVWGDPEADRTKRYHREWLGPMTGEWRFAKSYRTKFFAILAAVFWSISGRERVIDTRGETE